MRLQRRSFLQSAICGSPILSSVINKENLIASNGIGPTHFAPKAKRVIFLFMTGGVSHVDTFDPKPALTRDHGKEIKADHPEIKDRPGYERIFLKKPQWEFQPYGQSGTEVSQLFPYVAQCVDDIAMIRSMHTSHSNHYNATLGMHTGSFSFSRPSIGSWVTHGLGTENRDLPNFMVIAPQQTYAGTQVYSSDFLPARCQGTLVIPGREPIRNIQPRITTAEQKEQINLLKAINNLYLADRNHDTRLSAQNSMMDTAFGMQTAVPDAFNFSQESEQTLKLYGVEPGKTTGFGWQCLAARRLIERGVEFVELIDTGSSGNWDAHGDMMTHVSLAKNVDQPIAALLKDLKRSGLLSETLVVWTTEFGRTPFNSSADAKGREHHPWAFTSWMAGAGVKPGIVHGATDEHGLRATDDPVHVHDFHATILHLMGFDHEKLTYRHAGRDYRLTDVHGTVVKSLLS